MFLIWYDNDRKRALPDKVRAAAERYRERFGDAPTLVLLNPADAADRDELAGLTVRTTVLVSPNHLYVGIDDAPSGVIMGLPPHDTRGQIPGRHVAPLCKARSACPQGISHALSNCATGTRPPCADDVTIASQITADW